MEQLQLLPEFISNHLFLVGAFLVVMALLLKAELEHQTSKGFQLDAGGAIRVMNNDDAVIIDIRSDAEYAKAHIKDARHIAQSSIESRLDELNLNKDDTIVVYCNVGNQSNKVCRYLRRQGYTNILNLKGGLTAWQDANLPVTSK